MVMNGNDGMQFRDKLTIFCIPCITINGNKTAKK